MSAATNLPSEDHFLCSICLDVFTDPVSIPCGHNFCKNCITQHWDVGNSCQCPMCKKKFNMRPELHISTFISEMVSQFRRESQQKSSSSSSEQQAAKPGEVLCDVCTGTKLKALKSCLVCLISYCETHLEPHLTMKGLKRHQLMDPVENLEGRMCMKHDEPLKLFCKTEQTCICVLCSYSDHKTHDVVPLTEECEGKKAELGKTEAEMQQMIQKRRLKIEEIKESVKKSKDAADGEKAEGVQVFTALKESVERRLNELIKEIEDKQKRMEKQAEDSIKDLEQEISELMKRSSEVEQLLKSEDHFHLLQSFSSLKAAPPTKDWTEVRVCPPSYEGTVVRAVAQLEEMIRKEMKKKLMEAELKRVQQYAVDVTLDPDTAHLELILSEDGKQVKHGDEWKKLPDNPERFSYCVNVLGNQSFSSGRFYFEVQVKGKTEWDLGVARESINRKGEITLTPQNAYWTVVLRNGNEYSACEKSPVRLHLQSGPEKVGVFVDYEEGLVSFYDVDAAALIYSFTGCSFNYRLLPYLSPCNNDGGQNSAPLVITPINHTASSSCPLPALSRLLQRRYQGRSSFHPLPLLSDIDNGFLLPALAPALHKLTVEEVTTTTAYLHLFPCSVSEPALLHAFPSFIPLHMHGNVRILDPLVSRVNTVFKGSDPAPLCY
ncbi:E3 ubiquitin-protein ligase TRIM21-like [Pholidichthys leucotaenia]